MAKYRCLIVESPFDRTVEEREFTHRRTAEEWVVAKLSTVGDDQFLVFEVVGEFLAFEVVGE